jgi:hypothetical protein
LVKPSDIVGIKSNVWYHLPTPRPLEEAIQRRLLEIGVKEENMDADDRGVLHNPVFEQSTGLINIRPMRTHHWSGLGTLLKNYIMFVRAPWMYHGNACENLGAIWRLPHLKDKTRLNILVMLTPLFHGIGPHHFSSRYMWHYRNAFFGEEKPISPPPLHISAADTRYGLGNSRPERIQLIKLGWEKDVLL